MSASRTDQAALRGYASVGGFADSHKEISCERFDRAVLEEIRLFDVPEETHFYAVEEMLDRILHALPAIKRIFSKPLIRLRDTHELRPIEAVRVIDNQTLAHIAVHSEIWSNVTQEGIIPRKLMTIENKESYVIYENLVFVQVVDSILRTLDYTKHVLKDILYGGGDFQVNLFDRTHHKFYFHAIGKLHLEYARSHELQYEFYLRCVEKIMLIERTLVSQMHAPVYTFCKKKKKKVSLKKTNAFRSHKDYKQLYLLSKWMDEHHFFAQEGEERSAAFNQADYEKFCLFMSIFAVEHFQFTFPENQSFNFEAFQAVASYKAWTLHWAQKEVAGVRALVFRMEKDAVYTLSLILSERQSITGVALDAFQREVPSDEYLFASECQYGEKDVVYLSIYNMDSFRRVQQMLLRAMIFADTEKKDCPFCGGALEAKENGWLCPVCRADIQKEICPDTQKPFYTSSIKKHQFLARKGEERKRQEFLHDRYAEAQLHFRNITLITEDGLPICPHCKKNHALS